MQTQLSYLNKFQANKFFILLFIFLILVLIILSRRRHKIIKLRHALHKLVLRIENWGLQNGVEIDGSETPLNAIFMISKKYPDLKSFLSEVSYEYELLVYKEEIINSNYKNLEKRWDKLIQK